MPPRYVYWTIIVDGQPTAFRSGSLEDIMPTFNRLKEKQPSAELKWFQNGQLWASRHDAQESVRARGGRAAGPRQGSTSAEATGKSDDSEIPRPERAWNAKPAWKTRTSFSPRDEKPERKSQSDAAAKPEWKPKGSFTPSDDKPSFAKAEDRPRAPRKSFGDRDEKPAWKPKSASARGSFGDRDDRPAGQARGSKPPEWKPKGTFKPKEAGHASGWGEKPGWKPKGDKPAWSPKGDKPAWLPKGDKPAYAKSSTFAKAPADRSEGKPAWKPKAGGSPRDQARSSFRPKSYTPKTEDGMTRSSRLQSKNDKLEWKPASERAAFAKAPSDRSARNAPDSRPSGPNAGFAKSDPDAPKRKWVPKAEYKKSLGIEVKRDDKWRPGGEHVDPKQKYKDAKKAKWTRVKATIRARSSKPRKPKDE